MKTLNARWKMIGLIAAILVVVGIVILLIIWLAAPAEPTQGAGATTGASSTVTTVENGTPGGTSTASAPSSGNDGGTENIPPAPGSTITIHLLTPLNNNVWIEGQANPIAWDNAADVTGEIDLVNATTKQFIGVILAETGPKQTSYTWNAEQVYLGRYSANEVAVVPGVYSIRIHFDGNGLGDLVSGPITITK